MVCVGIDVAKDKHDCFILSSEGEVLADAFTIANNRNDFETLLQRIRSCSRPKADYLCLPMQLHRSHFVVCFMWQILMANICFSSSNTVLSAVGPGVFRTVARTTASSFSLIDVSRFSFFEIIVMCTVHPDMPNPPYKTSYRSCVR